MTQPAAPTGGYIIDASALGLLGGKGSELSRSLISGMIVDAIRGNGPPLHVPAAALLIAAMAKSNLAEHVIRLTFEAPDGTIEVDELGAITVAQVVPVAAADPAASIDIWHATYETLAHQGWTLVTGEPERYRAWAALNILELR